MSESLELSLMELHAFEILVRSVVKIGLGCSLKKTVTVRSPCCLHAATRVEVLNAIHYCYDC